MKKKNTRTTKVSAKRTKPETKSFKKVLAEIESPQDWGNGF